MSNTIKVRRGTVGDLPTLEAGELGVTTDTHQAYFGDGVDNHELEIVERKAVASGYPSLDGNAKIPIAQIPIINISAVIPPLQQITGVLLPSNGGTGTTPSVDGQLLVGTDIQLGVTRWDLLTPPEDPVNYYLQSNHRDLSWVGASGIDHDLLYNYVADEHIDHTSVTLTAGVGLSGGGDLSANRTFTFDATELEAITWGGGAQASIVHTFNVSGTDTSMTYGNGIITASCPFSATTGFRIGGAATSGKVLIGNGTNFVESTPTFPNASVTSGKFIISDGTNWVASTPTISTTTTAGKILVGDGTNWVSSTPKYPNASATAGKVIRSDGTDYAASTFTIPDTMAINTILYASAANVLSALATGNSGVFVTSAGGIPSISTTLPNGLTFGTLGADWDIGDTRHLVTDTVMARDAAGLELFEDGGTGIFVKDGGNVGIGTITPSAKLAINGGLHVGGDSDPGNDNLLVDGTITCVGQIQHSAGANVTERGISFNAAANTTTTYDLDIETIVGANHLVYSAQVFIGGYGNGVTTCGSALYDVGGYTTHVDPDYYYITEVSDSWADGSSCTLTALDRVLRLTVTNTNATQHKIIKGWIKVAW
jgi:hypothetical protein